MVLPVAKVEVGISWLPSVSPGPNLSPASLARMLEMPGWGSVHLLFSLGRGRRDGGGELLLEGRRETSVGLRATYLSGEAGTQPEGGEEEGFQVD